MERYLSTKHLWYRDESLNILARERGGGEEEEIDVGSCRQIGQD